MTEIEPHQQGNQVATTQQTQQSLEGDALVQWAFAADRAYEIAKKLAGTAFVPSSMRGNADNITAAVLAGQELGIPPMAALRSIDVIHGTPGMRAHAMRGLVQSKGHQVQLVESSEEKCVIRGRRKGESDDDWQHVTWSIKRAEKLGLTGKGEWKKQPQTMLVARATGEICRLIASDVLHAMPYASEELDGYGQSDGAAQVPRVTIRELVNDSDEGVAEDDPWNPKNAVGVDNTLVEVDEAVEEAATFDEYMGGTS